MTEHDRCGRAASRRDGGDGGSAGETVDEAVVTPTASDVRRELLKSERFTNVVQSCNAMELARNAPMRPDKWSDDEQRHTIQWARGVRAAAPEPLKRYFRKVAPSLSIP